MIPNEAFQNWVLHGVIGVAVVALLLGALIVLSFLPPKRHDA